MMIYKVAKEVALSIHTYYLVQTNIRTPGRKRRQDIFMHLTFYMEENINPFF